LNARGITDTPVPASDLSLAPRSSPVIAAAWNLLLNPTDFSPEAEPAGRVAGWLAELFGSKMHFAHVTETPMPPPDPLAATVGVEVARAVVEDELVVLRSYAQRFAPPGCGVEMAVLQGSPGPVIAEYAGRIGASAIVVATHGRHWLGRLIFGSVSETVMGRAPCPVVTVRPDAFLPADGRRADTVVAAAVDFSPTCEAAIAQAVMLADRLDGRLEFLHVSNMEAQRFLHETTRGPDDELPAPVTHSDFWQRKLEDFVRAHVPQGRPWGARVEPGKAADRIAAFSNEVNATLLCIGTHTRAAIGRLLLGSTASDVVRSARCAVVTVRARK